MYNRTVNHTCICLGLMETAYQHGFIIWSAKGQHFEIILSEKCRTVFGKVISEKTIRDNEGFRYFDRCGSQTNSECKDWYEWPSLNVHIVDLKTAIVSLKRKWPLCGNSIALDYFPFVNLEWKFNICISP